MAKKILVAISNDFIRETYLDVLKRENFEVLAEKEGEDALSAIEKEMPDLVLADIKLSEPNGFKIIEKLRENDATKRIPVIIYTPLERKDERAKAMELEAKDFIIAAEVTPLEVARRVKIALGEQRSYRIGIHKNLYNAKELITDLGYLYDFKCPKCSSDLILYLIRDLSKGKNYFILSVICPECSYTK